MELTSVCPAVILMPPLKMSTLHRARRGHGPFAFYINSRVRRGGGTWKCEVRCEINLRGRYVFVCVCLSSTATDNRHVLSRSIDQPSNALVTTAPAQQLPQRKASNHCLSPTTYTKNALATTALALQLPQRKASNHCLSPTTYTKNALATTALALQLTPRIP